MLKTKSALKRVAAIAAAAVLMNQVSINNCVPVFASEGAANVDQQEALPNFMEFTGKIIEIREFADDSTKQFVTVENEEEALINFIASQKTYYADGIKLELGMEITGFYDATLPMLMIYPPQPEAVAFWQGPKEGEDLYFVKLDRFDENLTSRDGQLKLNLSDDAEIILQNGDKFKAEDGKTLAESLNNRALMVFYDVSTRSIPAQTTPKKIVVLYETAVPIPAETSLGVNALDGMAGQDVDVVIEGNNVGTTPLVLSENNTVMVPLYLVSDALDMPLVWEEDSRTVMMGRSYAITIGEDNYTFNRTSPIELGEPPIIVDDRTYVPISFFTEVMQMNNAYFLEGQIVIDNFEKMN